MTESATLPDEVGKLRGGGVSKYRCRDGTLRFRARIYRDGKEVPLGLFDTETEAAEARREAELQLSSELVLPGNITLADWGLHWLDRRELDGVRGIRQERSIWRRWIASGALAELPLRSITRVHIVHWIRGVAGSTSVTTKATRGGIVREDTGRRVKRQTVVHALRLLRSCLRDAADEGRIATSPAVDVKVPKMPAEAKGDGATWTWLRPEEIVRALETTHVRRGRQGARRSTLERTREVEVPEAHRVAWTVLVYTGLRMGELVALHWSDVHTGGEHPHLAVQGSHDGPTKSTEVRQVPLLPPARAALRAWRKQRPGIGQSYVFPSAEGGMQHDDWDAGWSDWGAPIVGRHVRAHDLRHTCASHLVQGTWGRALSLLEVKEWMGHSSITVTMRYAHLAPDSLRGAAKELARAWDRSEKKDTER